MTIQNQKSEINQVELSTILYYADFLSLKHASVPVTDTCKYFFIHGVPMNISFIVGLKPEYKEDNAFFQQSKNEYIMLRDKFGDEGVMSFINNICNLSATGSVNAIQILKCIHFYSNREQRDAAFKKYKQYKRDYKYTMPIKDDDGKEIFIECSKYVAHVNTKEASNRSKLFKGV